MPINSYKCDKCDFEEEYIESFSTSKETWHPEICPKCNDGKMTKEFAVSGISFDVLGGFSYCYGRKALNNKSSTERAEIINGANPY